MRYHMLAPLVLLALGAMAISMAHRPQRRVEVLLEQLRPKGRLGDTLFLPATTEVEVNAELDSMGSDAFAPLKYALHDGDDTIRFLAATQLGRMKDPRAASALMQSLSDRSVFVRERSIYALGEIGDKTSLTQVIRFAADSNSLIRSAVAVTLGKMGRSECLLPLSILLQDSSLSVRSRAAKSFGDLGDLRALPILNKAAGLECDESIRQEVKVAIERLTSTRGNTHQ